MFKCTLSNHKDIGVHRNCIFGTQSFQEINVDSGEGHVGQMCDESTRCQLTESLHDSHFSNNIWCGGYPVQCPEN